jgi:hypothetical protein
VDRLGKQGFARACLPKQYNWDVGLRGERGQLEATRHSVIARSYVFEPYPGQSFLHRCLLLQAPT